MTNLELNRDIKRLSNKVKNRTDGSIQFEDEIKNELRRLYYADREFTAMNKQSVLILLRLNLRYRAITLHHFGISINL